MRSFWLFAKVIIKQMTPVHRLGVASWFLAAADPAFIRSNVTNWFCPTIRFEALSDRIAPPAWQKQWHLSPEESNTTFTSSKTTKSECRRRRTELLSWLPWAGTAWWEAATLTRLRSESQVEMSKKKSWMLQDCMIKTLVKKVWSFQKNGKTVQKTNTDVDNLPKYLKEIQKYPYNSKRACISPLNTTSLLDAKLKMSALRKKLMLRVKPTKKNTTEHCKHSTGKKLKMTKNYLNSLIFM